MSCCPYCNAPLVGGAGCQECGTTLTEAEIAAGPVRLTRVESGRKAKGDRRPAGRAPTVSEGPDPDTPKTPPFLPSHRPGVALLSVLDDGSWVRGEVLRIRSERLVIGRTEGDVQIPHDEAISGRHAEITRKVEEGRTRWYVSDLDSRNGTFVRVTRAALRHGHELLLGGARFQFRNGGDTPPAAASPATGVRQTRVLVDSGTHRANQSTPELVEVSSALASRKFRLTSPECWAGRDAGQCTVTVDNPFACPRHAKFGHDALGRWWVEDAGSVNGTWLRVRKTRMLFSGWFLLGEQRFQLRIP